MLPIPEQELESGFGALDIVGLPGTIRPWMSALGH